MRAPKETEEQRTQQLLQRWAEGKATLKEVRGYSDEELYAIARTAWVYFYQGKIPQARTLFQGLYAVNPVEPYFAKALGVIEFAAGNVQGALSAWDVAIKLAPNDAGVWVGRAEVKIASNSKASAVEDLRRAQALIGEDEKLKAKISALLQTLTKK
ncbi:MAG: tetratricopeptide repeat protein [Myxococcaceae bacterium]|nr:tetratricopeptide repeat protein [Myxococcaceae bacterium]